MDDRERDLAEAADELADTLQELRMELQQPPEGPLGVPRPPKPRELLQFTEQYTIPALIALFETSIRVLELLAGAIRLADGRPLDAVEDSTLGATGRKQRDRLEAASRTTLRKLDDALVEMQSAAAGGEPDNPEVQRLLGEARELRNEVAERLEEASNADANATEGGDSPVGITVSDASKETDSTDEEETVGIDVDSELESIKREVDGEQPDRPDSSDSKSDAGDGLDETPDE